MLEDYASIAKIVIALFSVLGFGVSIYFSRKTLVELKRDRRLVNKPHLAFERGGYISHLQFDQIKDEPGKRVMPYSGEIEGYVRDYRIGELKNYGTGTAFEIEVKWKIERIQIDGEFIQTDSLPENERKLYILERNRFVTNHGNLMKGEESWLLHFPNCITFDFARKIERADGRILIIYKNSCLLYTSDAADE